MKTQMHRKAIAIAAVVMLGLATTGGAAFPRVDSFGGGHIGAGSTAGHIWVTLQRRRRSSIPKPKPRSIVF